MCLIARARSALAAALVAGVAAPAPAGTPALAAPSAQASALALAATAVRPAVPLVSRGEGKTWKECVALALERNPDVVAARRNYESAVALRKGAFSPFLPSIAASASAEREAGQPDWALEPYAGQNRYAARLSLSQNLFAGFADQARLEQARAAEATAAASLRIAKSKAINDLAVAFQGLAYARDAAKLSEQIIERRDQNLRLVELRFESGRENKGSYLLSQANLEQAKYDYLRSVDQIPAAQALLRRGLDEPNKAVDAIGEIPVAPPPAPPTDFESLAATLPEARQAREASASARAGVEIARAAFLPAIKLDASLGRIGDDVFPKQERSRLLLEVTIPLFDGGRDLYGARGASALLSAAGAAQAGNLRQLAATLTQAYSAYVEAEAQLKVNGAYVRATETRSEIARRQYENGLLGFDQWDIIENDLIARQRALVASKRDRALAERAWLQATSQEEAP